MPNTFDRLQFTRDWNNPSDFPTYEENEQKVRADLQALHDEVRDYINDTLIPGIEGIAAPGTGDMRTAVYDTEGKRRDVFKYAEEKAASALFDSKVYMDAKAVSVLSDAKAYTNRTVSNPNLLENGDFRDPDDYKGGYVVLAGEPIYHDAALSSLIANLAYPCPVVERTATYCKIRDAQFPDSYYYTAASAAVRGYVGAGYTIDRWKTFGDNGVITLDTSGITLRGSVSATYLGQLVSIPQNYVGKEYTFSVLYTNNVFATASGVLDENNPIYLTNAPGGWDSVTVSADGCIAQFGANTGIDKTVIAAKLELGSTQTLAHQEPDGNWVLNDFPVDKRAAKIQTGSYIGTGTLGENNPNSVTFNFVPKHFQLLAQKVVDRFGYVTWTPIHSNVMNAEWLTTAYTNALSVVGSDGSTTTYGKRSEDGKTLYWYVEPGTYSSASTQFNTANTTYYWVAFG